MFEAIYKLSMVKKGLKNYYIRQRWFYCEELTFHKQLYSIRCTTE